MNARAQQMVQAWQQGVEETMMWLWDGLTSLGGAAAVVGNTDGFAAELHDQANRVLMTRELLRYDSTDNRAVVATHNPDTAAHVATFVPGAQTDLARVSGTIVDVDDFVSVGGIGTGTSHAGELNLPVEHVWATENSLDDLADTGRLLGLRTDPAGEAFGAQVFDSDSPVPLDDIPHNQYFNTHPENRGLTNIGHVIAGRAPVRP